MTEPDVCPELWTKIRSHRSASRLAVASTLALAATGAFAGAACSSGAAAGPDGSTGISLPDAAPAAIGCADPDPGVLDFIDNMEDGDNLVLMRAGRNGSWYTFHDPTAGTLNPDMGQLVAMEPIPGDRCGTSNRAMRVTGSGFSEWGSGFGVAFKTQMLNGVYTSAPYDLGTRRGITFWARTGETSVGTIRMGIGDGWSVPEGGHCDASVTAGSTACYDHFGGRIDLTPTWKRYTFQWGELEQRAFGVPRDALDTTTAYFVEFTMPPSAPVFDIWIDDIALY